MKTFCLAICAFHSWRLKKFLPLFKQYPLGIEADVFFIHNLFEPKTIINRRIRSESEISEVINLLRFFDYENKIIIERENVGEDLGAYHFIFNLLKNEYEFFFFLNESVTIKKSDWLKKFYDVYRSNEKIVGATPQICPGIKYKYCMPTSYWSLRSSFAKTMKWSMAKNRKDAELQEMELVWPQSQENNLLLAQVGTGDDLMSYKNKSFYKEGTY